MRYLSLFLCSAAWCAFAAPNYFEPAHRLNGVGVDREDMTPVALDARAKKMIETQTFTILRDPKALSGAERINSPRLQKIFRTAGEQSGLPPVFISAVAYLESWGVANAESPAGPKGIMQVTEGTARTMGLKVVRKTKYRSHQERRAYKTKSGKTRYKNVTVRVPYVVTVRDDRFRPELAVPAAARYLARLETKFGGRDWAVFGYHCGEGCIAEVQEIVRRSKGLGEKPSVPAVFFAATPSYNRELYNVLRKHMERDFSPTYYFRIMRAEQLLNIYKEDKREFARLVDQYVNRPNPSERAPNRLSVWIRADDAAARNSQDPYPGIQLARAFDNSEFFGFTLRRVGERDPANREQYLRASPAALGTLAYVAFETRRLHESMNRRGEKFVPLDITTLVTMRDSEERNIRGYISHTSGRVFDISTASLPPGELEALEFVLDDIGYYGYLGYVEVRGLQTYTVGPSPTSGEFFGAVFEDAANSAKT